MMDNEEQAGDERTTKQPPRQRARDIDQSSAKVDTTGKKRDFSYIVRPLSDCGGGSSSETGSQRTKAEDKNQEQKGEPHLSARKDFAEGTSTKKTKGELIDVIRITAEVIVRSISSCSHSCSPPPLFPPNSCRWICSRCCYYW
jgi:hypothetical protein